MSSEVIEAGLKATGTLAVVLAAAGSRVGGVPGAISGATAGVVIGISATVISGIIAAVSPAGTSENSK